MDFIGRVENLQSDLETVFSKLGMGACPKLPQRRSRAGRKSVYNYDRYNIDPNTLQQSQVSRIREIYQDDVDLIDRRCPEPALQEAGKPENSTRSRALENQEKLSPVEFYSQVNQSYQDCVVYCFGDRGFYAELSSVARAMIYAWHNGYQLLLDSKGSAWSSELGWSDYFEPFCPTSEDVDPTRIKERFEFVLKGDKSSFRKLRSFNPDKLDFGSTQLTEFKEILIFFIRLIFQPRTEILDYVSESSSSMDLPESYDAIHVRRGDKVGDEDIYYPVGIYLDRLLPLPSEHTLFVMSDDYEVIPEVKEYLLERDIDCHVVSLSEPGEEGFDVWKLRRGESFMGKKKSKTNQAVSQRGYTFEMVRRLIAETLIAANSDRFISTRRSNVGLMVNNLHHKPENCQSIKVSDVVSKKARVSGIPDEHPIVKYRRLNEGFEDCVLYSMANRGFFAEITSVARAMIYALANRKQLLLDSADFAWRSDQGWSDYFKPFCYSADEVDQTRIKQQISFKDRKSFKRLSQFKPQRLRFGSIEIEGFFEILGFFLSMIFRPTPGCQKEIDGCVAQLGLPAHFDVIHIRRGDKIGDEDVLFPASDYLKILNPMPQNNSLLVMTDDYSAVREVSECLAHGSKKINMVTLCQQEHGGFDQGQLRDKKRFISVDEHKSEGSYPDYVYDQVIRLLAEVSLAVRSRTFVSTKGTNIGWAVWMMHPQKDFCHLLHASSLDPRRDKIPPQPPKKFRAEIQLRDGLCRSLELPAASPTLSQLRLLVAANDGVVKIVHRQLLQLPIDGGQSALSFSNSDIRNIRIIPSCEHPAARKKRVKLSTEDLQNLRKRRARTQSKKTEVIGWSRSLARWANNKLHVKSVLYLRRGPVQAATYPAKSQHQTRSMASSPSCSGTNGPES